MDATNSPAQRTGSRHRLGPIPPGAWRTVEQTCPTCQGRFVKTAGGQRFCAVECRPSVAFRLSHRTGRHGTFLVQHMTPAEFTFLTIMERKGITLDFLNPHSRQFRLNGTSFTPDFHRPRTRVYFEVVGTRQALWANKGKYIAFRKTYPALTLKVVKPDGTEIHIEKGDGDAHA